ncbi:MAG: spore cortex biosynthesis protein YabQ [Lachnospiraceae bacterium]|nr:spore cortex biosynthesis protein YabQ [Lachnospiraceae bacterium]
MFFMGVCFGILYDVLRVMRRLLPVGKIAVDITDVLYWVVVTAWAWYVQNQKAEGVIRFCQLLAVALGMLLYYIVLSPVVMWLLYTPIHFVGKLFAGAYRYIVRGIDAVGQAIHAFIQSRRKRDDL